MPTMIQKIKKARSTATVLASIPQGRVAGLAPSGPGRHGRGHALILPLMSFTLGGCAQRGAPSFALFGAYFPAWMLCVFLGVLASIGARALFVATGLSTVLPFQLFVCMATGVCFALLVWFIWFA